MPIVRSFQRLAHVDPEGDRGAVTSRPSEDFDTIEELEYRNEIVQSLCGGFFADLLSGRVVLDQLIAATVQILDDLLER